MSCDVCDAPLNPGPVFLGGGPILSCGECLWFAHQAAVPLSAVADFLELCRTVSTETADEACERRFLELATPVIGPDGEPGFLLAPEAVGYVLGEDPPPENADRRAISDRLYAKLNSCPPPGTNVELDAEEWAEYRRQNPGGLLSGVLVPWEGEGANDGFKQMFEPDPHPSSLVPHPPGIAGTTIPAPDPPDPGDPPHPDGNVVRVFQWPPHCGQWYGRIGARGDRRSIQYGPLRTAAEVLEGLARHLAARQYRFDGGYEPPAG